MEARLQPCHHCMSALNYCHYAERTKVGRAEILADFNLEKFFEDFKSIFRCLPIYTSDTFPMGDYPKNWARITWETRNKVGWICSCCGVNSSGHASLLHTHHRDGNRGNVKPSNLEVLCLACHKSRPFHSGLVYPANHKMRIENLRIAQHLPRICKKCEI